MAWYGPFNPTRHPPEINGAWLRLADAIAKARTLEELAATKAKLAKYEPPVDPDALLFADILDAMRWTEISRRLRKGIEPNEYFAPALAKFKQILAERGPK